MFFLSSWKYRFHRAISLEKRVTACPLGGTRETSTYIVLCSIEETGRGPSFQNLEQLYKHRKGFGLFKACHMDAPFSGFQKTVLMRTVFYKDLVFTFNYVTLCVSGRGKYARACGSLRRIWRIADPLELEL